MTSIQLPSMFFAVDWTDGDAAPVAGEIAGPEPVYPHEAREARVEGTRMAKCVITTEGGLKSCRTIESLPFLDQPVLDALAQRRCTPVSFQGRKVAVEYVIPFKFKLQ